MTILDDSLFRDATGTRKLSNDSFVMTKLIKKQLLNDIPSEILSRNKVRIENTMDGFMIITVTINVAISMGLKYFIELINALHIILF